MQSTNKQKLAVLHYYIESCTFSVWSGLKGKLGSNTGSKNSKCFDFSQAQTQLIP